MWRNNWSKSSNFRHCFTQEVIPLPIPSFECHFINHSAAFRKYWYLYFISFTFGHLIDIILMNRKSHYSNLHLIFLYLAAGDWIVLTFLYFYTGGQEKPIRICHNEIVFRFPNRESLWFWISFSGSQSRPCL